MHPNNLVQTMEAIGYSLSDLRPAFPSLNMAQIDALLRDCALALERPVLAYGLLGISPCSSPSFNITTAGYRWSGGEQPWPPSPDNINVFCFGGSTMVGYNLADKDTIPALMRKIVQKAEQRIQLYNFGSGAYTSRHGFLRLLQILDGGLVPDAVLFMDGFNDCMFALGRQELVVTLNHLYQTERRRRRMSPIGAILDYAKDKLQLRNTAEAITPQSHPLAKAELLLTPERVDEALAASERQLTIADLEDTCCKLAVHVWERYLDTVNLIEAVSARRSIRTLYAWQPVPYYATAPRHRIMPRLYHAYPESSFCSATYHWLHDQGFPGLPDGVRFANLSAVGREQEGVLYQDVCHYTAGFNAVIAETLAEHLLDALGVNVHD